MSEEGRESVLVLKGTIVSSFALKRVDGEVRRRSKGVSVHLCGIC